MSQLCSVICAGILVRRGSHKSACAIKEMTSNRQTKCHCVDAFMTQNVKSNLASKSDRESNRNRNRIVKICNLFMCDAKF